MKRAPELDASYVSYIYVIAPGKVVIETGLLCTTFNFTIESHLSQIAIFSIADCFVDIRV